MADWKKELKDAYDNSAAEKVNESNRSFRQEMAQANANALSKGMGRSSYAAQTLANVGKGMEEAANRIRTDFDLEYLKALREREMQERQLELERDKLAEEKRQFDLKMAGYGTGGGGGYGGYSSGPSTQSTPKTTPSSFDATTLAATANAINTANLFANALSSGYKTNQLKKTATGGAGKSVNMVR